MPLRRQVDKVFTTYRHRKSRDGNNDGPVFLKRFVYSFFFFVLFFRLQAPTSREQSG